MKVVVLAVGRLKETYLRAAEDEYKKRLSRYARLEIIECKDDAQLLAKVPERALVVLLDERGQPWSSPEIAHKLIATAEQHGGGAPLCFCIGGADGLPQALHARATHTIAFGRITLPHRLARIVLVEQLYRAFTIVRGEPYHHA
jgi:23S rRNA (pseudouridine1915-N3)-methyltransferase